MQVNHKKPKVNKWLTIKNFIGTQRLILLAGCLLLAIGIGAFFTLSPISGDNEPVQKQQAPTLEQAQQEAAEQSEPLTQVTEPEQSEVSSTLPPEQAQSAPTQVSGNQSQTIKQAQAKLTMPADGEIIRAFSGEQLVYNKTLNAWSTHNGIDIAVEEGMPIYAALAGEVSKVKMDSTLGWVITIDHNSDQTTVYAGVGEVSVAQGDKVNAGQQIAMAGTPPFEKDLGPHLHFEYLAGGKYADPTEKFASK